MRHLIHTSYANALAASLVAACLATVSTDGRAQTADSEAATNSVPTTSSPTGPSPTVTNEPVAERETPTTCTYQTYSWSVEERRAVNRERVEKPYSDVTDDERDPDEPQCTVCSEDQVEIDPATFGHPDAEPFQVCVLYKERIEQALRAIAESDEFELVEITGYRVGRTRGRVVDGVRTEWSNHSFGTAVDINADFNGLYGSCNVDVVTPESLDACSRRIGGRWDPEARPERTVVRDGAVYRAFTEIVGWRWGGEISGNTRDLMHFSVTGY